MLELLTREQPPKSHVSGLPVRAAIPCVELCGLNAPVCPHSFQDESTAEITFYMKGADVAMSTIVQYNDWLEEEVMAASALCRRLGGAQCAGTKQHPCPAASPAGTPGGNWGAPCQADTETEHFKRCLFFSVS